MRVRSRWLMAQPRLAATSGGAPANHEVARLGVAYAYLRQTKGAPKKNGTGAGAFGEFCMRSGLCLATMLAASSLAAAETPPTIGQLWEIAAMRAATTTAPRSCCFAIKA